MTARVMKLMHIRMALNSTVEYRCTVQCTEPVVAHQYILIKANLMHGSIYVFCSPDNADDEGEVVAAPDALVQPLAVMVEDVDTLDNVGTWNWFKMNVQKNYAFESEKAGKI